MEADSALPVNNLGASRRDRRRIILGSREGATHQENALRTEPTTQRPEGDNEYSKLVDAFYKSDQEGLLRGLMDAFDQQGTKIRLMRHKDLVEAGKFDRLREVLSREAISLIEGGEEFLLEAECLLGSFGSGFQEFLLQPEVQLHVWNFELDEIKARLQQQRSSSLQA